MLPRIQETRSLGERNASWALGYDREMSHNGACYVKTLVPSYRTLIDCSRPGPPREGRTNMATLDVPCLFLLCLGLLTTTILEIIKKYNHVRPLS